MAKLDQYLQHKAKVLASRRQALAADPAAGVVALKAQSEVAGNTGVRPVTMGDYIIISDSAPGLAGHSLGPSSPEMALGALASCLVHTYLLQAALLDIALDNVEVEVTGEIDMEPVVGITTADDAVISLQNLAYQPKITAPAALSDIEKLHLAVERTCAVLNTLRQPMTVRRIE